MRIPALELEQVVVSRLVELLCDPVGMLDCHSAGAIVSKDAIKRSRKLVAELTSRRIVHHRPLVRKLIRQVIVREASLPIYVDWPELCSVLSIVPDPSDEGVLIIETMARLARSGLVLRMVDRDGTRLRPTVDLTLVRLIVKARDWWERLRAERGLMVSTIAREEGVNDSYVTRVLRPAFLSPSVVQAIIDCRQPVWMDGAALCAPGAIALDWEVQKQRLLLGRAS